MKNVGSENNLAIVYLYNIIGLIKIISYISKSPGELHISIIVQYTISTFGMAQSCDWKKKSLWNKNICLAHNFPFFIKSKLNSIQNSYKNYNKLQTTQPAQNSPNFKFCVINIAHRRNLSLILPSPICLNFLKFFHYFLISDVVN